MQRRVFAFLVSGLMALGAGVPAFAHHGWSEYDNTRTLTLTSAQTDTVTATANAGGSNATAQATGTVSVNSIPTISIDSFSCDPNASTLVLTATASGGSGNYVITFDGVTCAPGSTCSITRGPGSYTATVTDGKSCTSVPATRKIGLCTD